MFNFFHKKRKGQSTDTSLSEVAASKVAGSILRLQQRWADGMGHLTRNWTISQKIIAMALFLLLLGANSGIALYQVFHKPAYRKLLIDPGGITVPHLEPISAGQPGLELRRELNTFHSYLDSLKSDSSGIVLYRKLVASRPGLIDSLEFLIHQMPQQ